MLRFTATGRAESHSEKLLNSIPAIPTALSFGEKHEGCVGVRRISQRPIACSYRRLRPRGKAKQLPAITRPKSLCRQATTWLIQIASPASGLYLAVFDAPCPTLWFQGDTTVRFRCVAEFISIACRRDQPPISSYCRIRGFTTAYSTSVRRFTAI